jgi:hypothetical protein
VDLDQQVVDQQELVVADHVGLERDGVERVLVHEVVARRVGVEVRRPDERQIGLVELLAGLEGAIEDRLREHVAHLDPHQRLTAAGGRLGHLDVQAVVRRAFVFEIGLPLDFNRFEHAGHA